MGINFHIVFDWHALKSNDFTRVHVNSTNMSDTKHHQFLILIYV